VTGPNGAGLAAGQELPEQRYRVTRADLVRYAGASGDFNPIHWSDRVATSVGLPGVIAHGMFTMALVGRALDTWAGEPGRVRELGCKFTKPVVVPDDETGTEVVVAGTVASVADDGSIHLTLTVTCEDVKVMGAPKAVLAGAAGG
jgi:acyl dehydratase